MHVSFILCDDCLASSVWSLVGLFLGNFSAVGPLDDRLLALFAAF